ECQQCRALKCHPRIMNIAIAFGNAAPAALDSQPSMGHSCDSPFGLQSYCLLVTNSFSGPDRMDNLLKDHRCPRSGAPTDGSLSVGWRSLAAGDLGYTTNLDPDG